MPIRFRCEHCNQLLSIGRRKAGTVVNCPTCGTSVVVPDQTTSLFGKRAQPTSQKWLEQFPPIPAAESGREVPAADALAGPGAAVAQHESRATLKDEAASTRSLTRASLWLRPTPEVRRADQEEELDLTPMVDVTFLLLIFFMLTASFNLQKAFPAPVPDPQQQGARQALMTLEQLQQNHVVVRIDADNSISVDGEPTPLSQLVSKLRETMRSTGRTELLVTPDDQAWHDTVVQVIDAGSTVGAERVRLAMPSESTPTLESAGAGL